MEVYLYAIAVILPSLNPSGGPQAQAWLGTIWAHSDEEARSVARGIGIAQHGNAPFAVMAYRAPDVRAMLPAPAPEASKEPTEAAVDTGGIRVPPGPKTLN